MDACLNPQKKRQKNGFDSVAERVLDQGEMII
jgi:hypothetical protein